MINHWNDGLTRTGQRWTVGQTVKVGFMSLRIVALRPTPGDGEPDAYEMVDDRNGRRYDFVPHRGVVRIS